MEYLLVEFPEQRGTIVDGIREGMTNQVLELESGNHRVTLEGPPDFTPGNYDFILRRTSELCPRVVRFENK